MRITQALAVQVGTATLGYAYIWNKRGNAARKAGIRSCEFAHVPAYQQNVAGFCGHSGRGAAKTHAARGYPNHHEYLW
jgi:hypothetical protein